MVQVRCVRGLRVLGEGLMAGCDCVLCKLVAGDKEEVRGRGVRGVLYLTCDRIHMSVGTHAWHPLMQCISPGVMCEGAECYRGLVCYWLVATVLLPVVGLDLSPVACLLMLV